MQKQPGRQLRNQRPRGSTSESRKPTQQGHEAGPPAPGGGGSILRRCDVSRQPRSGHDPAAVQLWPGNGVPPPTGDLAGDYTGLWQTGARCCYPSQARRKAQEVGPRRAQCAGLTACGGGAEPRAGRAEQGTLVSTADGMGRLRGTIWPESKPFGPVLQKAQEEYTGVLPGYSPEIQKLCRAQDR